MDALFKENRLSVQEQIEQLTNVQVVIIDRWTLSGTVYAKLRFEDIGKPQSNEYYEWLKQGELLPNITMLLDDSVDVVFERMQ
jgi:thymidylate kinase